MEEKVFNEDFFKKLSKINLALNLRLNNGAQGGRKSKAKGVSVEFSDFREYTIGDDFRRIDWNAYGRLDKFFVKIFMEEREAVFNFFLDKSKSMDFGEKNKKVIALRVVAALSYIAINNLDKVIINTIDSGNIAEIKGGVGNKGFQRLLKELENIDFEGKTDLASSIMKRKITNRGISIVVSDFFNNGGLEELERGIKYLAYKKQQIILVQVLCEEEENPTVDGEVTLIDAETNEEIKITLNHKIITEYKKTLKSYNEELEKMIQKYGGKLVKVNTNATLEEIILEDFARKRIIS